MENYQEELLEIKHDLCKLEQFSPSSIKMLERILDRYDVVVKELIDVSQTESQKSARTIQFIRQKLPLIKSKGMIIAMKRNLYVKVRRVLLHSVERDLNN